jgi:hypothetical protein
VHEVPIHRQVRTPLAVFLSLSGLALAAGCSVAPAGATVNSPAVGPVQHGSGKNFPPFPVPAIWNGKSGTIYKMVVKAKTGTTSREFGVTAKSSMVFWLNCIGKGKAQLASPAINLKWDVSCGNGNSPGGITFAPPHAALGKQIKVLVTVSRNSRWEVRIDEALHTTA